MKAPNRIAVPIAALIVVAGGQSASAQEASVQSLISPNEQSLEVGIIGAFDHTRTAGKYTGLDDLPALPLVNGSIIHRDEQTGTWFKAIGTDLGLNDRGLRLEYERQGDWKYYFDYSQIQKSNPLQIFTGLTGTDSNLQFKNGTAVRELDLSTDRYNGKLGMSKRFSRELDLQVSYQSEYKNGGRQFGVGVTPNFVVDPIDQWVHEVDAKLNYTGKALQMTGGVLGSFFENKHKALHSDTSNQNVALPPDNQAYNVYLNGGYNISPTTRGAFKLSYNRMVQSDTFFTTTGGLANNNRTDLGGEVDNYLAMASVNSRLTNDLTLLGKVRYEGRHDNTPVEQYVTPSSDRNGRNIQFDRDTVTADGEANYRLPDNYRLTGAVKYEYWDRSYPPERQASWRIRTDEYSGRAQVSKRMTESLGGNVAYIYSSRTGSSFLNSDSKTNYIDPIHWGDRERQQWRLNLNWTPAEKWSVQALVDGSLDTYHTAGPGRNLGPEEGTSHNASVDASYQLTRDWNLTAFVSRNEVTREQKTIDAEGSVAGLWKADLRNLGYAGGVGVRGTPRDRLKIGADIQYSYDKNEYKLTSANPAIVDLPDIAYRQIDLKMFADYALSDNGSVKFSYQFTHLENSDFTYDVNIYADGTIIRLPSQENSHFVGVSYKYRW